MASPTASAFVMRPGTQVRRIFQSGMGRRILVATSCTESTTDAVPRITVESSFTGITTVPRPLVATNAHSTSCLAEGAVSMTTTS